MNYIDIFNGEMTTTPLIALATSSGNIPNVRLVNFAYDPAQKGIAYFGSFPGNQKMTEMEENPSVSFVLIPTSPEAAGLIRVHGTVKRSEKSIKEMSSLFLKTDPNMNETISLHGDILQLFEIHFDTAEVTVGMTDKQTITL